MSINESGPPDDITNESGPPDDEGTVAAAYGCVPIPAVYDSSRYVVPGTDPEDIPIFTLNDIVEVLTHAQENLQQTTHPVYHKVFASFRDEAEKQARADLNAEMVKFYRSQGISRGISR